MPEVGSLTDAQANYLVSIVMCGNFRDAADTLFVTPSTISQSMAALEAEYGAQIMLRTRGGIVLTPLGEKLYFIARDIVKRFQDAEALKEDLANHSSADLNFAVFGSGVRQCIRTVIQESVSAGTSLNFHVYDGGMHTIADMLQAGTISFAVISAPSSFCRNTFSRFSCQILTRTNMMLRVSTESELCAQLSHSFDPLGVSGTYTLSDLSTHKFVFSSYEMLHIMEDQVPTFPWRQQTIVVSSDEVLLSTLIRENHAVGVSFDDHLFPQKEDGTVFIPMYMGNHLLNMHTFAVANDIKALSEPDKFVISEIRRHIFRQSF
jgi:DNA-binding transcriptional LysR family regulator